MTAISTPIAANDDMPGTRYLTLDDLWRPPAPSRATRKMGRRSRGSSRAVVIGGSPPREIQCDSNLEKKCLLALLARRDVADIREQPPAVLYRDDDGRWRRHTFDFLVTLKNRTRIAIEVKPLAKVIKHGWHARIKHIAEQADGLADRYVIVTEANLPRDSCYNNALLWAVRREVRPDHDEQIRTITADLHGSVSIANLVARSGLDGDGFRAIARLIDKGELIVVGRGRIDYPTFVSLAKAA